MSARLVDKLIERGAQFWILLARKYLFRAAAMALQQLHRHKQLTPRCIERKRRHHLGYALGKTGMAREVLDLVGCFTGNSRRERKQYRRGVVDITLQRRHGRHRVVVEVELMLL